MAKELPYFRFYPGEWLKGDITMMDHADQGVFINLCCFYWLKGCSICLANVKQRFSNDEASVNRLLEQEIFSVDESGEISIDFLDDQYFRLSKISEKRSRAGRSGFKAKANQK